MLIFFANILAKHAHQGSFYAAGVVITVIL
jgi:hypothetical protein